MDTLFFTFIFTTAIAIGIIVRFGKRMNLIGKIWAILFALIGSAVLSIFLFFLMLGSTTRKHTYAEWPASAVVTNEATGLKAYVILRHYYPGGLGEEPVYGFFLIVVNQAGKQFENGFFRYQVYDDDQVQDHITEQTFDVSWETPYKIILKRYFQVQREAYFVNGFLHVYDPSRDVLVSDMNTEPNPPSTEILKKLEPLNLDNTTLNELEFIDLSDFDMRRMGGLIINEDPGVLLYIKESGDLFWTNVLSVGPIMFEGESGIKIIASLQWVFFKDSYTFKNKVYADRIYFYNNEGDIDVINGTQIQLSETKAE